MQERPAIHGNRNFWQEGAQSSVVAQLHALQSTISGVNRPSGSSTSISRTVMEWVLIACIEGGGDACFDALGQAQAVIGGGHYGDDSGQNRQKADKDTDFCADQRTAPPLTSAAPGFWGCLWVNWPSPSFTAFSLWGAVCPI